ncbi:hypothetical protein THRCLA_07397 [Thraustotheca clavata]|uniref:Uncharacterized protein n=1 Tax=Thraustotheca clavata TaxID=74557 RepID=A0A1V9ZDX7_9STRA|nr:hypothetical protein THRCLA_07397 [Thraustotheca clavata]
MKRRRTIPINACCMVLLNEYLFEIITSYQNGLYFDLLQIYLEWTRMHAKDGQYLLLMDQYLLYMDPISLQKLHVQTRHPRFLLHLAIVQGQLITLDRWLRCVGQTWINYDTMNCAARHGQLNIIEYLYARTQLDCNEDAMAYAAGNGHLNVVEFFYKKNPKLATQYAFHQAAEYGHLKVVHFFLKTCPEMYSKNVMDYAAANGHLHVVRYLHYAVLSDEVCSTNAMDFAAANGHLDVVKFLHMHRTEGCTWNAMDEAAANGHLNVVCILHQYRTEGCSHEALQNAQNNGHSDVVAYLKMHGLGTNLRDSWKSEFPNSCAAQIVGESWPSIEDSLDFLIETLKPSRRNTRRTES